MRLCSELQNELVLWAFKMIEDKHQLRLDKRWKVMQQRYHGSPVRAQTIREDRPALIKEVEKCSKVPP